MITRETKAALLRRIRHIGLGLFTALAVLGQASHVGAAEAAKPGERLDVASVKSVRPTLVDTIAALQKRDIVGAKAAFESYDSLWNGVEMYVSVRSKDMSHLPLLLYSPRLRLVGGWKDRFSADRCSRNVKTRVPKIR